MKYIFVEQLSLIWNQFTACTSILKISALLAIITGYQRNTYITDLKMSTIPVHPKPLVRSKSKRYFHQNTFFFFFKFHFFWIHSENSTKYLNHSSTCNFLSGIKTCLQKPDQFGYYHRNFNYWQFIWPSVIGKDKRISQYLHFWFWMVKVQLFYLESECPVCTWKIKTATYIFWCRKK